MISEVKKNERILSELLEMYPKLNPSGFAHGGYYAGSNRRVTFEEHRQSLLNHADMFEKCCNWLENLPKPLKKSRKNGFSSYFLKGIGENIFKVNRIPNGVIIAAGLYLNLEHELPGEDDQNVYFYIDKDAVLLEMKKAGM